MDSIRLLPPVVPKQLSRRVLRKIKLDKGSREQDVKINKANYEKAYLSFDSIGMVTSAALNMKIHREHPETLGNVPLNVKEEGFKRLKQQANVKGLPEEKRGVKKEKIMAAIETACYKCHNLAPHKAKYGKDGSKIFFCDRCGSNKDIVERMKIKALEDDRKDTL